MLGGVLLAACSLMCWQSTVVWCAVRFLAGFSYGFIYISLVAQIADNTWYKDRPDMAVVFLIGSKLCGLFIGFLSNLPFTKSPNRDTNIGFVFLFFPIIALIYNRFKTYDTITQLLNMGQEEYIVNTLTELRAGIIPKRDLDESIRSEIAEKKLMLLEDYASSTSRFCNVFKLLTNGNASPIFLLVCFRFLYVITSNIYLVALSGGDNPYITILSLLIIRMLLQNYLAFSIDSLDRRKLLLIAGLCSGILLFPFAFSHMGYIHICSVLLVIITYAIHISVAIGIEPVHAVYETEAFPLSKRNGSLAIVTCFEYVLQGTITIWLLFGKEDILKYLLVATPVLVISLTIILFKCLPEIKSMSLRECRDAFNKNSVKRTLPHSHILSHRFIEHPEI